MHSSSTRFFVLFSALLSAAAALCACSSPSQAPPKTSSAPTASTTSKNPEPTPDPSAPNLHTRTQNPAEVPSFPPDYTPDGLPPVPKPGAAFPASFVRGVAVGLYLELPDLDYARIFNEVRAHGATDVSLVVAWSQTHIRSVEIAPDPVETLPDERLKSIIGLAHNAGLRVTLFPIVHLKRRRSGEWRGLLKPTLPDRWWASYKRFILHHARIAAETETESFSVGSELLSLESERARWLDVIQATRKAYSGTLLYSSNWDHFHGVTFWDALDVAGMTGYFELSTSKDPTLAELKDTWDSAFPVLSVFSQNIKKPLVITEVGYPAQIGGAAHPWDYTLSNPTHHRTQYLAYRAMYESWREYILAHPKDTPNLRGVFFWSWNGYGGPGDGHYTPRGKPASAIVKRWFQHPPSAPKPSEPPTPPTPSTPPNPTTPNPTP